MNKIKKRNNTQKEQEGRTSREGRGLVIKYFVKVRGVNIALAHRLFKSSRRAEVTIHMQIIYDVGNKFFNLPLSLLSLNFLSFLLIKFKLPRRLNYGIKILSFQFQYMVIPFWYLITTSFSNTTSCSPFF